MKSEMDSRCLPNHEFLCFSFGEPLDRLSYPIKPTVCLMIADNVVHNDIIVLSVQDAIAVGCTFFMTWGLQADALHDAIDHVVENGNDEWLNILTTSHAGEPLSEVLDFLQTGALPGNQSFRCLLIGDKPVDDLRALIMHLPNK